ncbi:MAG: PorV/PorQ family protein [Elusimicrobiota bacterium]|nr:PorV/PorQ family protein [Elusimicrobiota bacterium]
MRYIRDIAVMLFLSAAVSVSETGAASGAEFLKIGAGARPEGMAGAFTAIADDASSLYWNPAGMGFIKRQEAMLGRMEYIQKTAYSRLFYVSPFEKTGAAGAEISYLNSSDIPAYDNNALPLSDINTGALSVVLGMGAELQPERIAAGINLKFVSEDLAGSRASAYAADAGILIKDRLNLDEGLFKIIDGWRAGAALRNLGSRMKHFSSADTLPLTFSAGGAAEFLNSNLLFSLQADFIKGGSSALSAGAEYHVHKILSLRAGWREKFNAPADSDRGLRAGLGIQNKDISVDYAYSPYRALGSAHRLSLSAKFGRLYRRNIIRANIARHLEEGKELYRKGDLVAAAKKARGVLKAVPGNAQAKLLLEKTENELSRIENEEEIKKYLAKGKKYFRELDIINAQDTLLTVIELDSSNREALEFLRKIGRIVSHVTDPRAEAERAEREKILKEKGLDKFLADIPEEEENLLYYYTSGLKFAGEGEPDIAAAYFRRAAAEAPDSAEIWFHLGKSYSRMGENRKALDAFGKAVEIEPDYLFAHYEIWDAYFKEANFQKALEAVEKSIELMPDYGQNYIALGKTHEKLGDYPEAVKAYEKLYQLWGGDKEATELLIEALLKAGEKEKAQNIYCEFRKKEELPPDEAKEIEGLFSEEEAE